MKHLTSDQRYVISAFLKAGLIFDDFGLQPLDNNSRLALLQILEEDKPEKILTLQNLRATTSEVVHLNPSKTVH